MTIVPLTPELVPALLDTWLAQRTRRSPGTPTHRGGWERPFEERRAIVERMLRAMLGRDEGQRRTVAAVQGDAVAAYLIGRDVQLPRGSHYRTYVPEHFLNIGGDDWAIADPHDLDALAELYADVASWSIARGAASHLLTIPAGDDCTDFWLDFGFARHDRYAFIPLDAVRPGPTGLAVRRAGPADLDLATGFVVDEARHHLATPIFAYEAPHLDAAKRRDMAESLADTESFVLIAEAQGQALGGLSAFFIAELPFWMPSATPTPCVYIDSSYVHVAARGRGVLRGLVAALAEVTAPFAPRGLFATYLPANLSARRAWEGLGFQPLVTVHQRRFDPAAVRQHRQD
jgi:GNAT superfamily N-acetyltransferase